MIWYDEDFPLKLNSDKAIAAYKTTKASANACYSREWEKMDPNHTADQYDIVSFTGGKVSKVENSGDCVPQHVYGACNLAGLGEAARRDLRAPREDVRRRGDQGLDAIRQRLAGM